MTAMDSAPFSKLRVTEPKSTNINFLFGRKGGISEATEQRSKEDLLKTTEVETIWLSTRGVMRSYVPSKVKVDASLRASAIHFSFLADSLRNDLLFLLNNTCQLLFWFESQYFCFLNKFIRKRRKTCQMLKIELFLSISRENDYFCCC